MANSRFSWADEGSDVDLLGDNVAIRGWAGRLGPDGSSAGDQLGQGVNWKGLVGVITLLIQ